MPMLKKTIFLVILASLVSLITLPSIVYGDDWVYVGKVDYFTLYYNSSSLKIDKQNKTIKVWVKFVYTEKGKIRFLKDYDSIKKQEYIDINHSLYLYLLDYKNLKYDITHMTDYSKSGNALKDNEYPINLVDIIPDSTGDVLINKVIKDYNIQK